MNEDLLVLKNLSKQFRSHWTYRVKGTGIDNLTFNVKKGESFALLGANGAGKTTTIKCILGLIKPTNGEVIFDGERNFSRSKIGFLPEQPYFYQHLSVSETLNFYAGLFGYSSFERDKKVKMLLDKINISHLSDRKVKTLSKGQQQRVGIAQALINDPDFVILDEPFSGLDPVSRVEIKELFRDLKDSGKTMMISSHVLSDIEELCDRAIILKKGAIKKEVQIKELGNINSEDSRYRILLSGKGIEEVVQCLKNSNIETENVKTLPGEIICCEFKGQVLSQKALNMLMNNSFNIVEYSKVLQSLEDIFVEVSKEQV